MKDNGHRMQEESWWKYWNKLVPGRIFTFSWVAKLQMIFVMDKFRKGHMIVNRCPILL